MNPSDRGREGADHVVDGVEEADDPLPSRWVTALVAVVAFGFGFGSARHAADLRSTLAGTLRDPVAAILAAGAKPAAEAMAVGAEVFRAHCASCHGLEGQGLIGPNLTDRYWLHGARPTDILRVVRNGVPANGMPAWGEALGSERSVSVAAFVASLRGRNLDGKEPQGLLVD